MLTIERRSRIMIKRMTRPAAFGAATVALALAPTGDATAAKPSPPPGQLAPIHGTYAPTIDPANFVARIDNRYLPYTPGTRIHFEGSRGGTAQTDDEVVLHRT